MDLKKEMVIIDNKIVTNDILYCNLNIKNNTYLIKYKGSNDKLYNFSTFRVKHLTNPTLLNLKDYNFYIGDQLLQNINEVYEFKYGNYLYYHVIFENTSSKDYTSYELKKVDNSANEIIEYLKKVSEVTSLDTDDGKKILYEQMKKIKIDDLDSDSALANYLKISDNVSKQIKTGLLIFPFGCNSSQYEAVKNAIHSNISVIEGPPGTGKTQTILNIIANIIIRNMNCQVVSNNNTAIENIDDKLKKYGLDFFVALLGKKENKQFFIEHQSDITLDFDKYKDIDINDIKCTLKKYDEIVKKIYDAKKTLGILNQNKSELELEYKHFNKLIKLQKVKLVKLNNYDLDKMKLLWNEMITIDKLSIWKKLKYIFIYKVGNFNFYNNELNVILKSIQNQIYLGDLNCIKNKIKEKTQFIKSNIEKENKFVNLSMDYLKKYLSSKYKIERKKYSYAEMLKNCEQFLSDYPVVLSTTYSSKNIFDIDFKFDYIIMDESSQIDVATGTLALSSARYAVVIGDEKQLPNVISTNISKQVNKIFNEFSIDENYSYTSNSFLSSIKKSIPNAPNKMLVEHYRCHPKIINFCNKKFYNNKLVVMSEDNNEEDVIKVIRTNKGNHARDNASQRQVDIIKEILPKTTGDVGIIVPYNNQVNLIKENINYVEVSTVHKFQGREKDTIIISTVEDDITDFVGDDKILNVAISRAKKQLYFIVTGNEIKNSNINDFIDYVSYNNMEVVENKIYSSFDLLYKQYELERLEFFKKHNRILKYDSENIIYYLIKNILNEYETLDFHFHQSLNDLIVDKSLLNEDELKYASHPNTHVDFYVFSKLGYTPVLVIEVDGYKSHKNGTKQYKRDLLKNSILEKYDISYVRLKTNGSGEEQIIRDKLNEIMNCKKNSKKY